MTSIPTKHANPSNTSNVTPKRTEQSSLRNRENIDSRGSFFTAGLGTLLVTISSSADIIWKLKPSDGNKYAVVRGIKD